MSARDDYPHIATLATSGRIATWAPTRDEAHAALDEIDRLRQMVDELMAQFSDAAAPCPTCGGAGIAPDRHFDTYRSAFSPCPECRGR